MKICRYVLAVSLFLNVVLGFYWFQLREENKALKAHILSTVSSVGSVESKIMSMDKSSVQVTAYTATEGQRFANGVPVAAAISPMIEKSYKIKMGDTIVLFDRNKKANFLCRVVDRTSQDETRPVVDLLFRDKKEAVNFGRKNLLISKIEKKDLKEATYVLVTMDAKTWLYSKELFTRSMEEGIITPDELPLATAYWLNLNRAIGYNHDKESPKPKKQNMKT